MNSFVLESSRMRWNYISSGLQILQVGKSHYRKTALQSPITALWMCIEPDCAERGKFRRTTSSSQLSRKCMIQTSHFQITYVTVDVIEEQTIK